MAEELKTVLAPDTLLRNRYSIVKLLGRGGMGAVYQALDRSLNCDVTIKETFATDEQLDVRKVFKYEAQLLANIRHPSLPKATDYFEQGDGLFFVMEYIPGIDLEEKRKINGGPFLVGDVLKWADTLLDALAALHSYKPPIVHRDIKPANLKLTPEGELFLLDFGLAKGAAGQMSTLHGPGYTRLQGYTLSFAPLEQINGDETTPQSDLYSLAATLWCLLAGTPPKDAWLRSVAVNRGEPDPLLSIHKINPEVPPAVSSLLSGALNLTPGRRPRGAAEMRKALRDAVEAPARAAAAQKRREEDEDLRREAQEEVRREAEAAARGDIEFKYEEQLRQLRADHNALWRQRNREHQAELEQARDKLADAQDKLRSVREQFAAQEEEALAERGKLAEELAAEKALRARHEEAVRVLEVRLDEARQALRNAEYALARERAVRDEQVRSAVEAESARLIPTLAQTQADLKAAEDRAAEARAELSRLTAFADAKIRSLETAEREATRLADELRRAKIELEREREAARSAESLLRSVEAEKAVALKARDEASERAGSLNEQRLAAEGRHGRLRRATYLSGGALLLLAAAAPLAWFAWGGRAAARAGSFTAMFGGVGMEMVKITGGTFRMGSPKSEGRKDKERPQHEVTVPDFSIGRYEVTQAQWRAVARLPKVQIDLEESPSSFKGDDLPVESVSWDQAAEFCARLSKATGRAFRLPTEAEWEYAARAGKDGAFTGDPYALSWNANNSGKQPLDSLQLWLTAPNKYQRSVEANGCQTHPVGQKQANAFGLYDMLGNVWEWCADNWHDDYQGAPADGSPWLAGGDPALHPLRGGNWFQFVTASHPAERTSGKRDVGGYDTGFRVVSVAQQ